MIPEILFILVFSLLLVILLVPVGGVRTHRDRFTGRRVPVEEDAEIEAAGIGVGVTMLFFFLLLFPLILAASVWIGPRGPHLWGVSWAPIVITGILLALLIAAIIPPRSGSVTESASEPEEPVATGVTAVFGLMFFLLFFAAIVLIVAAFV